jgi:putative FmdB family regulatory protein
MFSWIRAQGFFRQFVPKSFQEDSNMPIYEYECTKCGAVEEAIQNFSDKPLTTCKNCSGHLHKLISQSSFHLKGTGWYVTDYAGKNHNATSAPKKSEDNSALPSAETPAASSKTSDSSDS